jgi:hypothetical protein
MSKKNHKHVKTLPKVCRQKKYFTTTPGVVSNDGIPAIHTTGHSGGGGSGNGACHDITLRVRDSPDHARGGRLGVLDNGDGGTSDGGHPIVDRLARDVEDNEDGDSGGGDPPDHRRQEQHSVGGSGNVQDDRARGGRDATAVSHKGHHGGGGVNHAHDMGTRFAGMRSLRYS